MATIKTNLDDSPRCHNVASDGDLLLVFKNRTPQVQMRVSKEVVTRTSQYFQDGLALPALGKSSNTGVREVIVNGFDPEAVLILMNIVHARARTVPKRMNIEFLHTVVMHAWTFGMLPSVRCLCCIWANHATMVRGQFNSMQVAVWMLNIMLILNMKAQFKSSTRRLITNCSTKDFVISGTVLSPRMFDHIRTKKAELFETMADVIFYTVAGFLKKEHTMCTKECDVQLLYDLREIMQEAQIGATKPSRLPPLLEKIRENRILWHIFNPVPEREHGTTWCILTLEESIIALQKKLAAVTGLTLADWRPDQHDHDISWSSERPEEPYLDLSWPYFEKLDLDWDGSRESAESPSADASQALEALNLSDQPIEW